MENFLIFVAVLVFVFVRWAIKEGKISEIFGLGEDQDVGKVGPMPLNQRPRTKTPMRGGELSNDERARKFLEALGLPADALPPPPVTREVRPPVVPNVPAAPQRPILQNRSAQPRPVAQPPRAVPVPEPEFQPNLGEKFVTPAETLAATKREEVRVRGVEAETAAHAYTGGIIRGSTGGHAASSSRPLLVSLSETLKRPDRVREAFLLREILAPAPGLQRDLPDPSLSLL